MHKLLVTDLNKLLVTGLIVSIGFAGWMSLAESFRYGFTADESEPYLKLPTGKLLKSDGEQLDRVDTQQPALSTHPVSVAPDVAPDVLLNAVTLEMIATLKQDRGLQAGQTKITDLIETKILPLCDVAHMTRIALARNWHLTTPEQQVALTAEFKKLLVHTYSTALSDYRNQVIEFRKLRMEADDTEVTVRSVMMHPGRRQTSIDYNMEKTLAGWKVYDFKIGGVSPITTYRETFADEVRDGGVDGLIKSLSDKNRQGASRSKPTHISSWEIPFFVMFSAAHSVSQRSNN